MWFFNSPEIVFGELALSHLGNLQGKRAVLVTDANLLKLDIAEKIRSALEPSGMELQIFSDVEPEPSVETVKKGAAFLTAFSPDWILAAGGGSVMDAAKAMWVLYERPDLQPDEINPMDYLGLRKKARFIAIPTTAGTGSEATWAIVLTDLAGRRKMGLGNREALPDLAILEPELTLALPQKITVDTGLDALTHAVEGFSSTWHNDFSDGLCLKACQLIFQYLPVVYAHPDDIDARTHLQNAAAIAGLGFGNSMAALAHGMGHALGAVFHVPHGRAVSLFLPYTIEFCVNGEPGSTRYLELANFLLPGLKDEKQAGYALAQAIRDLEKKLGSPCTLRDCGITRSALEGEMVALVNNAMNDTQTIMSTRLPNNDELRDLFLATFQGNRIEM
jgi:alcohol dehydrogenase class IV